MAESSSIEFTVVIPAYNPGTYLDEALRSVAEQVERPAWVVIVDDGSTDGTYDRATRLLSEHGLEGTVLRQSNQGISSARNAGLARRKTDWIALLDADDLWFPDHLARLHQGISHCPQAVAAFGDSRYFGDPRSRTTLLAQAKTLALSERSPVEGVHILSRKIFDALLPGLFIPVSGSAFRTSCATPEPRFECALRSGEDRYFFLQLSQHGPFVFVDRQTAGTRRHERNTTHHFNAARSDADHVILLSKLLHGNEFALDETQRSVVREAAVRAGNSLLYSASCEGLASYQEARRLTKPFLHLSRRLGPRDLLRATAVSCGLKKRGQPDRGATP